MLRLRRARFLTLTLTLGLALPFALPRIARGETGAERSLLRLADRYWRLEMRAHPTRATSLGEPGQDDRLASLDPEDIEAHHRRLERLHRKVEKIPADRLAPRLVVTRDLLLRQLATEPRNAACAQRYWKVDQMWGPQVSLLSLPEFTSIRSGRDAYAYLSRLLEVGPYMDRHIANLRSGLERDLVSPRTNVVRVIDQLEDNLGRPLNDDPLLEILSQLPEGWSRKRQQAYREKLRRVIADVVRPAFDRYRAFLEREILPVARDRVGLDALPIGDECYDVLIEHHTSLDLDAGTIHRIGLEEMARIRAEMLEITARYFPELPLEEVFDRLRANPSYFFRTRKEVETKARSAVSAAWAKLPEAFRRLPDTPCEVKPMERHAEKDAPIAYFRPPSPDGSRPGTYYVNTYRPETRPKYTAEVLAYHEAVPGHHLQIALANEIEGLPRFQKHAGVTAFIEGWALYSERVCDELGLYSQDIDRLGMLSFDAWRAARLVVDTGMHALGWSRDEAVAYMRANTASAHNDIENEVDRYISQPGQALAYKIGQREILRLRREAEARLGGRFDLREFHDRVLRNGAVTLPTLAELIETWIEEELAGNRSVGR